MAVRRGVRTREVTADELRDAISREVFPLLAELRRAVNDFLAIPLPTASLGGAYGLDFNVRRHIGLALTENVTSITMPLPQDGGMYYLLVRQSLDGGLTMGGWPSTVRWFGGGTPPTITATAGRFDLLSFYFDGARFFGRADQNGV